MPAAATDDSAMTTFAAARGFSLGLVPFEGAPVVTCAQASGASSLLPSLAILGLVAAVVA
jgi:hypothetical protein